MPQNPSSDRLGAELKESSSLRKNRTGKVDTSGNKLELSITMTVKNLADEVRLKSVISVRWRS